MSCLTGEPKKGTSQLKNHTGAVKGKGIHPFSKKKERWGRQDGRCYVEAGHVAVVPTAVFVATPNLCLYISILLGIFVFFLLLCSGEAS